MTNNVGTGLTTAPEDWLRSAVVYQVYIRSFADSNGDGLGDVNGLRSKLPYLATLNIDAIWINPWYPSPMVDAGYDVSDYRDIEPSLGTLDDAQALIEEAHALNIKVLLDIVPNHTSSEHEWFKAALAGDKRAQARYHFSPGTGPNEELPPNDWQSNFGGPAWTKLPSGQWYLHLFAPGQPDLNWKNSEVADDFRATLQFWFDRGVDGFRIDVAHGLAKAEGLPDGGPVNPAAQHAMSHPAWDQDEVHAIYRDWRKVADSYSPPRVFVAEAWVTNNERLARYVRPDELQSAFQFDFLRAPWRAASMKEIISDSLAAAATTKSPNTWVLSNHDVTRHVTRYARSQPDHLVESAWDRARWADESADLARGVARGRAAFLTLAALPGGLYVYQGEELGLEEVEDIPDSLRQDPTFFQTNGNDVGRDGCRVPIPWACDGTSMGFSPDAVSPWLPQPESWRKLSMSVQDSEQDSMLQLYRRTLKLRREAFSEATQLTWVDSPAEVLAFARGPIECWVNTGATDAELPDGCTVLLSSQPCKDNGVLPSDTAAWITRDSENRG